MSEHIPQWILALFALGSPVQEFLNRWIPERLRPLSLLGVSAAIVALAVIMTPLEWDAFHIQMALVYAVLTSGWALSRIIHGDPDPKAIGRTAIFVAGMVGAVLLVSHAWAQIDSALIVPIPEEAIPAPEISAGPAAPQAPAAAITTFIWAQVSAFIGAALVRMFSRKRRAAR